VLAAGHRHRPERVVGPEHGRRADRPRSPPTPGSSCPGSPAAPAPRPDPQRVAVHVPGSPTPPRPPASFLHLHARPAAAPAGRPCGGRRSPRARTRSMAASPGTTSTAPARYARGSAFRLRYTTECAGVDLLQPRVLDATGHQEVLRVRHVGQAQLRVDQVLGVLAANEAPVACPARCRGGRRAARAVDRQVVVAVRALGAHQRRQVEHAERPPACCARCSHWMESSGGRACPARRTGS
jgi:hypothetical protein